MEYNSIKLNNVELMDYMIINDVRRGISTEMTNVTENKVGDGSNLISSNLSSKKIEIDFTLLKDLIATKRIVGKITSSKQLQSIIFSDDPNVFWEVIIDGEIKATEHNNGKYTSGTLTFLVPNGYAESVDTKVLNNDNSGGENGTIINNADNSVSVLINNNGTLPIFPTIKITPTAESGFFGIAGQNVLEIGNPDEADEKRKTKQTTIADFKTQSDFDTNFVDATDRTTSW
ncbi:distal tail protein Dit, partial [Lactococcus lactis]|uniref:distal tail protein Dit n=1 Tax=Lactococcus lactis TaxID=1358 RepID=UPI001024FFDE